MGEKFLPDRDHYKAIVDPYRPPWIPEDQARALANGIVRAVGDQGHLVSEITIEPQGTGMRIVAEVDALFVDVHVPAGRFSYAAVARELIRRMHVRDWELTVELPG